MPRVRGLRTTPNARGAVEPPRTRLLAPRAVQILACGALVAKYCTPRVRRRSGEHPLFRNTIFPAFVRPQATSKLQEDQKRALTTRSGCSGGLWCAQAAAASARQAERCAVPAAAPSRERGPATNTMNIEILAGALTRGGVGHGFQRRPCTRSWPTPREPYPAHDHRRKETCQQHRPSAVEATSPTLRHYIARCSSHTAGGGERALLCVSAQVCVY